MDDGWPSQCVLQPASSVLWRILWILVPISHHPTFTLHRGKPLPSIFVLFKSFAPSTHQRPFFITLTDWRVILSAVLLSLYALPTMCYHRRLIFSSIFLNYEKLALIKFQRLFHMSGVLIGFSSLCCHHHLLL